MSQITIDTDDQKLINMVIETTGYNEARAKNLLKKIRTWSIMTAYKNSEVFKIALALIFISIPAHADELVTIEPGILQPVVEKYCDLPKPVGKKGEIIIWWERDKDGNCTVQKAEVVK